jgi:hypothetical protein
VATLTALTAAQSVGHFETADQVALQRTEPEHSPHALDEQAESELAVPAGHSIQIAKFASDTLRVAVDDHVQFHLRAHAPSTKDK